MDRTKRYRRRVVGRRANSQGGFTLLELIVVVSIIGILAAMALPNLVQQPLRTKEAVLKTNLRTLRQAIDQFYGDLGRYPESIEALVDEGYLRAVPIDPITEQREWEAVFEQDTYDYEADLPEVEGDIAPGVIDVFSLSTDVSLDGTPYNEW